MEQVGPDSDRDLRAIILGAGREAPREDGTFPLPRCLLTDPFGGRVMDWILSALRSVDINDITFVGGYHFDQIGQQYSDLDYIYNPDWEHSGVLASLYQAREKLSAPTVVSHADITYHPEVSRKLVDAPCDTITIAVDSTWRRRTRIDPSSTEPRKNLVILSGDTVRDIGFLVPSYAVDAEFVGLVRFGPAIIPQLYKFLSEEYPKRIGVPFSQAQDVQFGYMTDLLRHFLENGTEIHAVDIGDNWAEMDSPEQLARFVLGTKGETLERLRGLIKMGRFCEQEMFTIADWGHDRETVLANIANVFNPRTIVIRSSTHLEDSWNASHAGAFESILNVDSTDTAVMSVAIEKVIASYSRNGTTPETSNQILVQEMVQDVVMSGVVFTRDLDTGAPYYVLNYDDASSATDAVTSGTSSALKTVLVSRAHRGGFPMPRVGKLLDVVRELEQVTGCTTLDIEFACNAHDEVFVLQARPLTVVLDAGEVDEAAVSQELDIIRTFIRERLKRVPYLFGETTAFGDMPDWDPAEMIGVQPSALAASMYHYLIMNSAWRVARARIGYHDPEPAPLMISLAGHPLIDVRCSFNNLIPAAISDALKEKLLNHYLERLRQHPDMHDKVEFEICFTCLDFDFDRQAVRLSENGFSTAEIAELRAALLDMTDGVVSGRVEPVEKLMAEVETLNERRIKVLDANPAGAAIPIAIGQLLDDCIQYGTVPFSVLARYAFIGYSLSRSLVARGILTDDEEQDFLRSIESVATEMARDMNAVMSGDMPRERFLQTYGHLRPGAYDICSPRYDEAPEAYFPAADEHAHASNVSARSEDHATFQLTAEKRAAIDQAIKAAGFTFDVDQMFSFMAAGISLRERAKFEFTKTVSDILVLIERMGAGYGFSREDLSHLDIERVRSWGLSCYGADLDERIAQEIAVGRDVFERSKSIKIPHLIFQPEDIDVIVLEESRPNFVTLNKVTGQIVVVDHNTNPADLEGKLALIEGADPGFDWIFLHGVAGLITKYGGAASHMTIRAAEFGVPAAIGCGEVLFERLSKARTVELDCSGKRVHAL